MDDTVLEEIGLTKNEIAVYKALLQLGQTTTGPLTKKASIHRSRVYESLNTLIKKGLVSFVIKTNRKYFFAQNPEALLWFIDGKKQEVENLLPELKALQIEHPEKQEANIYEGYKGLRSIFEEALNSTPKNGSILVFGARTGQDTAPETWTSYFINYDRRRVKKGIKLKIIYNEDLRDSKIVNFYKKAKLIELKFISQKTPAGINIHGDNVAIILWKKEPCTFVITNKEVANSFREYFKSLWKLAKK